MYDWMDNKLFLNVTEAPDLSCFWIVTVFQKFHQFAMHHGAT